MREIKKNPGRGQYDRSKAKVNRGTFQQGHQGMSAENNPIWKGDLVGYTALHEWIYKELGQPSICDNCKSTIKKKYEWANISGLYKRDISDWKRMCVSCHRKFDGHGDKSWQTRQSRGSYCGKSVKQISREGDIIAIYPSINEAGKVTGIHPPNINEVINGKRKSAGGYLWQYMETTLDD